MLINPLIMLTIVSSFLQFLLGEAIINCRGPCGKTTDPVFLLPEARMLAPELLRGIPNGLLEDFRGK